MQHFRKYSPEPPENPPNTRKPPHSPSCGVPGWNYVVFATFRGPGWVSKRCFVGCNAKNHLYISSFQTCSVPENPKNSTQRSTEVTKTPRSYPPHPRRGGKSYLRPLFGRFWCLQVKNPSCNTFATLSPPGQNVVFMYKKNSKFSAKT